MKLLFVNTASAVQRAVQDALQDVRLKVEALDDGDPPAKRVKQFRPEMVILGDASNLSSAVDIAHAIKSVELKKYCYVILFASTDTDVSSVEFDGSGVDDIIFMPPRRQDLVTRFQVARRIMALENNAASSSEKLKRYVREDQITGLLNRQALQDELFREVGRAARVEEHLAGLYIKINNYSDIEEQVGEKTAHLILAEIAGDIRVTCRPYDRISRFAKADFFVMLGNATMSEGEIVATRLIERVSRKPIHIKDEEIIPWYSIGLSELTPEEMTQAVGTGDDVLLKDLLVDSLLRRSEIACDRAALSGINNFMIYTEKG